jgi:hypothetical protein
MLAAAMLVTAAACGHDDVTDPTAKELQALRESTAPYQDFDAAVAAGYDSPITSCWYHRDLGGMGYHYAKADLIDSIPSLMHPEALIYEPGQDGSMTLVGLEYLVPIAAWTRAEPPTFASATMAASSETRRPAADVAPSVDDLEFMRDDVNGVYSLHIWLWKDNPAGIYEPWNPDVSCQFADESEDKAMLRTPELGAAHDSH